MQRALQLFDAALEQPEAKRATWLVGACAGDDDLQREVEAMLAADGAGTADPLTPQLAKIRVEEAAIDLPAGTRIGAWELIGVLGRGGMGAVYRAARADG